VPNPAAEIKCEVTMTSKIPNRSGDIDRIIQNFWVSSVNHPENLSGAQSKEICHGKTSESIIISHSTDTTQWK
jgi:hypothetical protein